MNIRQSNPVIFFLLGEEPLPPALLEESMRRYMEGFVIIPAGKADVSEGGSRWFLNSVNNARRMFYRYKFISPGAARVNYITAADGEALLLPVLRKFQDEYLNPLYPSGVFTGVYCVMDDVNLADGGNERGAVLEMLQGMAADADTAVYLFSNVGSGHVLTDGRGLINAVSLLTLFKDAEPPVISDRSDAFRYMEFNFTDSCYARSASRGGRFLTAGYAALTFPRSAVRDLLAACFLSLEKYSDDLFPPGAELRDYAYLRDNISFKKGGLGYTLGIALPSVTKKELAGMTNGAIINMIFGSLLDKIVAEEELPCEEPLAPTPLGAASPTEPTMTESPRTVIPDADGSIYGLLRLSGGNGQWKKGILAALEENTEELESLLTDIKDWLARKPSSKDRGGRSLSFFVKQDLLPYRVAGSYMFWLYAVKRLRERERLLRETLNSIDAFNEEWKARLPVVEALIAELSLSENKINEVFSPFIANASGYFQAKFKAYAERNQEEMRRLTREMTESLKKNEFPAFAERLKDYIEQEVLPSREFNKPFMVLLEEMSGSPPQNLLSEWITAGKQYNIQLKTGFAGMYSEVNVFMPDGRAAELKQTYERSRERVNLFTAKDAESVEVLYHAGAFGAEDLYFKGLEKNSYFKGLEKNTYSKGLHE